jgi:hypothetical protein
MANALLASTASIPSLMASTSRAGSSRRAAAAAAAPAAPPAAAVEDDASSSDPEDRFQTYWYDDMVFNGQEAETLWAKKYHDGGCRPGGFCLWRCSGPQSRILASCSAATQPQHPSSGSPNFAPPPPECSPAAGPREAEEHGADRADGHQRQGGGGACIAAWMAGLACAENAAPDFFRPSNRAHASRRTVSPTPRTLAPPPARPPAPSSSPSWRISSGQTGSSGTAARARENR